MKKRLRKKLQSRPVRYTWNLDTLARLDIAAYIHRHYDNNLVRIRRDGPSYIGIAHKPKKRRR